MGRSPSRRLRRVLVAALVTPCWSAAAWSAEPDQKTMDAATGAPEPSVKPPAPVDTRTQYPPSGEGTARVVLELLIDEAGRVTEAQLVEGAEPFAAAALSAAPRWQFEPAQKDGVAVKARITFALDLVPPVPAAVNRGVTRSGAKRASPPTQPKKSTKPTPASDAPAEEIQVSSERPHPGARVMSDALARIVPGAEGDPVRVVEAMPGTIPIVSGGPFVAVRGAPPGKVGYDFDGIPLPYLFHIARSASVVHPWLVESATLYGGAYPARYGRASGGFVTAHAAEPEGKLRAHALVRLTDSAAGLEVPFAGGRGSFMAAGRYSYTKLLVSLVAPNYALDFWDYQGRARYVLSNNDRVELLAFGAGDVSSQERDGVKDTLFDGQFHRYELRFDHFTSPRERQRVAFTVGQDEWLDPDNRFDPRTRFIGWRTEFQKWFGDTMEVEFGGDVYVLLAREGTELDPTVPDGPVELFERTDIRNGVWVDWHWHPTRRTTITPGLRLDFYESDASPRDPETLQISPEPRFSLYHEINDSLRVHHSVGFARQAPSTSQRAIGRTFSVAGGLESSLLSDAGVEVVLPWDLVADATVFHTAFFDSHDVERLGRFRGEDDTELVGQGQAYGFELLLRRRLTRKLQGFLAYTLSRSERSFGRVTVPARFDRTHVVDLALGYDFGSGWRIAARGTFYSGFPADVATLEQAVDPPRTTPFYQIDWKLEKRWTIGSSGAWWGFMVEILNTTLHKEANDLDCTMGPCIESELGPVTVPTLGIQGSL